METKQLTIAQVNILLEASNNIVKPNDCQATPLVNLIRKRLVTLESVGGFPMTVVLTAKGRNYHARAKKIVAAWDAYCKLADLNLEDDSACGAQ